MPDEAQPAVRLRTLGLLAVFLYAVIWQNAGWEVLAICTAALLGGRYMQWAENEREHGRLFNRRPSEQR